MQIPEYSTVPSEVVQCHSMGKVSEWLQRRDDAAINDLIQWCRPVLRAIADRSLDDMLRSRVDASDMVQEACVDVARSMKRIRSSNRKQFWAYLRTTLSSKIEDARRRYVVAKKRSVHREIVTTTDRLSSTEWLFQVENEPLETLIRNETFQRGLKAISRLPRELQKVLRWRFRKGWTYSQIGLKVDRTEDDVRMLILRCLATIRHEVSSDDSR
jgi:RNA polymerase sigma factor (sigma-70 family)